MFDRLFTKMKFNDGAILWPSARETFSYLELNGRRIDFTVFSSRQNSKITNTVIRSSFTSIDNNSIDLKLHKLLEERINQYFENRNQDINIV